MPAQLQVILWTTVVALVIAPFVVIGLADQTEKPILLIIGDSVGARLNSEGRDVLDQWGDTYTIYTYAVGGSTSADTLLFLSRANLQADTVLCFLGANDELRGESDGLKDRVTSIRAAFKSEFIWVDTRSSATPNCSGCKTDGLHLTQRGYTELAEQLAL